MHYVELSDKGEFLGLFPLTEELAGTAFFDGILVVIPVTEQNEVVEQQAESIRRLATEVPVSIQREWFFDQLNQIIGSEVVEKGSAVRLFLLNGTPLTATELGTHHRGGNRNIE